MNFHGMHRNKPHDIDLFAYWLHECNQVESLLSRLESET